MPRVLLIGSPPFAEAIRGSLRDAGLLAGILTRPRKPSGRGQRLVNDPAWDGTEVPTWAPAALDAVEAKKFLASVRPDVAIVASYATILPEWFLHLLPVHRLNVHPSLLPRWRGPAPVPRTILAGDPETGITLHLLEAAVDGGAVLAQERRSLTGSERTGSLRTELAVQGAALLLRTLPEFLNGSIVPKPQPLAGVTWAQKVRRSEGVVDWSQGAVQLERAARAFDPWPHLTAQIGEAPLLLHELAVVEGLPNVAPGTLQIRSGAPVVATGTGAVELVRVQRPGRKIISGREFAANVEPSS